MTDETYWYGSGWLRLRSNLTKVCQENSQPLLDQICEDGSDITKVIETTCLFVDVILRDLHRRIIGGSPNSMWAYALRLLADPSELGTRIAGDLDALCGRRESPDPEIALKALVNRYLEDARRDLQPDIFPLAESMSA